MTNIKYMQNIWHNIFVCVLSGKSPLNTVIIIFSTKVEMMY